MCPKVPGTLEIEPTELHPKKRILSLFAHPHVFFFRAQEEDILKNDGFADIGFHCMD